MLWGDIDGGTVELGRGADEPAAWSERPPGGDLAGDRLGPDRTACGDDPAWGWPSAVPGGLDDQGAVPSDPLRAVGSGAGGGVDRPVVVPSVLWIRTGRGDTGRNDDLPLPVRGLGEEADGSLLRGSEPSARRQGPDRSQGDADGRDLAAGGLAQAGSEGGKGRAGGERAWGQLDHEKRQEPLRLSAARGDRPGLQP